MPGFRGLKGCQKEVREANKNFPFSYREENREYLVPENR